MKKLYKVNFRIMRDVDSKSYTAGRFYIEHRIKLTGTWIIASAMTFETINEAYAHINDMLKYA